MNPYLMSQDEAKLSPVIIKYNHMGVKCAIWHVWSGKGKHNVRHMARLVGKGLIELLSCRSCTAVQSEENQTHTLNYYHV